MLNVLKAAIPAKPQMKVSMRVYDLSNGKADKLATRLIGATDVKAIFHTGVVVGDREYCYGRRGIVRIDPDDSERVLKMTLMEETEIGSITLTHDEVEERLFYLNESQFKAESYRVLTWNCNHFAADLLHWLIPSELPHVPRSITEQVDLVSTQSRRGRFAIKVVRTLLEDVWFPKTTETEEVSEEKRISGESTSTHPSLVAFDQQDQMLRRMSTSSVTLEPSRSMSSVLDDTKEDPIYRGSSSASPTSLTPPAVSLPMLDTPRQRITRPFGLSVHSSRHLTPSPAEYERGESASRLSFSSGRMRPGSRSVSDVPKESLYSSRSAFASTPSEQPSPTVSSRQASEGGDLTPQNSRKPRSRLRPGRTSHESEGSRWKRHEAFALMTPR